MNTVLHLINTGGPGGAETVYVDLVRNLDPSRWRSVVVLPNREWMYDQLHAWEPAPIVRRYRGRLDLGYLSAMVRLIRKERVALVHGHFFAASEIASLLGLVCGIPAVATLHGLADIDGGQRMRMKAALLNRGLRRVVLVSQSLREVFLRQTRLRTDNMVVIPNGVDTRLFSPRQDPSLRRELGIGDHEFVVGAVGNLRTAKGYDVLLRAAVLLKQRTPGYRFVIVGQAQGALYDELRALRRELGLEQEVIFTGFRDDVHRAVSGFDLYAITSRSEGFSIATVQAMAAGLPVVATRCGGPEEILEDGRTGLLVQNESPEAVAAAVASLRADAAARGRLGAAARAAAESQYTVHAQVNAYERVYRDALRTPAPGVWRIPSLLHRASGASR